MMNDDDALLPRRSRADYQHQSSRSTLICAARDFCFAIELVYSALHRIVLCVESTKHDEVNERAMEEKWRRKKKTNEEAV